MHRPLTHEDAVDAIAFSADGAALATGSGSNEYSVPDVLTLWNTESGDVRLQIAGRPYSILDWLAFVQGGELLALPGDSNEIDFRDVREGKVVGTVKAYDPSAMSSDGALLASGALLHEGLVLRKMTDGVESEPVQCYFEVEGRLNPSHTTGLAFSPDQARLLCATRDGAITTWDAATGKLLSTVDCVKPPAVRTPTVTLSLVLIWIGLSAR